MAGIHIYNAARDNNLAGLELLLRQSTRAEICEGLTFGEISPLLHAILHKNPGMVQLILENLTKHVFRIGEVTRKGKQQEQKPQEQERKQLQQFQKNAREMIAANLSQLLSDEFWNDGNAAILLDIIFIADQPLPPSEHIFHRLQITWLIEKISEAGSVNLCTQAGRYQFFKWAPHIKEYDIRVITEWPEVKEGKAGSDAIYNQFSDQFVFFKTDPLTPNSALYYFDAEGKSKSIQLGDVSQFEEKRAEIMGNATRKRLGSTQFNNLKHAGNFTVPQLESKDAVIDVKPHLELAILCLVCGGCEEDRDFIDQCYRALFGSSLKDFLQKAPLQEIDAFLNSEFMEKLEQRVKSNENAAAEFCSIYYQVFQRKNCWQDSVMPAVDLYLDKFIRYGLRVSFQYKTRRFLTLLEGLPVREMAATQPVKEAKETNSFLPEIGQRVVPEPYEWLPLLNCLSCICLNPVDEIPIAEDEIEIKKELAIAKAVDRLIEALKKVIQPNADSITILFPPVKTEICDLLLNNLRHILKPPAPVSSKIIESVLSFLNVVVFTLDSIQLTAAGILIELMALPGVFDALSIATNMKLLCHYLDKVQSTKLHYNTVTYVALKKFNELLSHPEAAAMAMKYKLSSRDPAKTQPSFPLDKMIPCFALLHRELPDALSPAEKIAFVKIYLQGRFDLPISPKKDCTFAVLATIQQTYSTLSQDDRQIVVTLIAENASENYRVFYVILRLLQGERIAEEDFAVIKKTTQGDVKDLIKNFFKDYPKERCEAVVAFFRLCYGYDVNDNDWSNFARIRYLLPSVMVARVLEQHATSCSSSFLMEMATTTLQESKHGDETVCEENINQPLLDAMWQFPRLIARMDAVDLARMPERRGTAPENYVFFVLVDNEAHDAIKQRYYQAIKTEEHESVIVALKQAAETQTAAMRELASLGFQRWRARGGSEIFTPDLQQALDYAKKAADKKPKSPKALKLLADIYNEMRVISSLGLDISAQQRLAVERLALQNYCANLHFNLNSFECATEIYLHANTADVPELQEIKSPELADYLVREKRKSFNQLIEKMVSDDYESSDPYIDYIDYINKQLARELYAQILDVYLDHMGQPELVVIPDKILVLHIAGLIKTVRNDDHKSFERHREIREENRKEQIQIALKCIEKAVALGAPQHRVAYLLLGENFFKAVPVIMALEAIRTARDQAIKAGKDVKLTDEEQLNYLNWLIRAFTNENKSVFAELIQQSILDAKAILPLLRNVDINVRTFNVNDPPDSNQTATGVSNFLVYGLGHHLLDPDEVITNVVMQQSLLLIFNQERAQKREVLLACIKRYLEKSSEYPEHYHILLKVILTSIRDVSAFSNEGKNLIAQFITQGIQNGFFDVNTILKQLFASSPLAGLDEQQRFEIFCVCLERYPGDLTGTIEQQPPRFVVHYLLVLFQRGENVNGSIVDKILDYFDRKVFNQKNVASILNALISYENDSRYVRYVQFFKDIVIGYRDFLFANKPVPENAAKLQRLFLAVLPHEEKETTSSASLYLEEGEQKSSVSLHTIHTTSVISAMESKRKMPTMIPAGAAGNLLTTTDAIKLIDARYRRINQAKRLNREWQQAIDNAAFLGFAALFDQHLEECDFDACIVVLTKCRELWPKEKRIYQCYQRLGIAITKQYRQCATDDDGEDDFIDQLKWRTKSEIQRHTVGIAYEEARNAADVIRWEFYNPLAIRWKKQYLAALQRIQNTLDADPNPSQLAMTVVDAFNAIKGSFLGSTTQNHLLEYLNLIPVDGPVQFLKKLRHEINHDAVQWQLEQPNTTPVASYDPVFVFLKEKLPESFCGVSHRDILFLFHEVVTKLQNASATADTEQIRTLCDRHFQEALSLPAEVPQPLVPLFQLR